MTDVPWTTTSSLSQWDIKYLCKALFVSNWSKDPAKKVGCVITDPNYVPISDGFNGLPRGVNLDERLIPQDLKRLMIIHAEMNALHFAKDIPDGSKVYVTQPPCATCMASLLQRGASYITYLDSASGKGNLSEFWKESLKASDMLAANYIGRGRIIRRVNRDEILPLYKEMVSL